jgi:hypothetical protein
MPNSITLSVFFWWYSITPVYVGAAVAVLSYTIFALQFFFIMACWGKQALAKVFSSLEMCHSVSVHVVSWMAVT